MIANRLEFIKYCLRKLGDGFLQINITDDQIDDRVDEAIQRFSEHHFDGNKDYILYYTLTKDEAKKQEIILPQEVLIVFEIMQTSGLSTFDLTENLSNQFTMSQIMGGNGLMGCSGGLSGYILIEQYLSTMQHILNWSKNFRFVKYEQRLHIDSKCKEGQVIAIRCRAALDLSKVLEAYNDEWLKKYATEKIRYQWGTNLLKHNGAILASGITINATDILNEAKENLKELEDELINKYTSTTFIMMG